MRVLITGITGFLGSHQADFFLGMEGIEVYGTKRWRSDTRNIAHCLDRLRLSECDLRDLSSATLLVENVRPDIIFHQAAQSFVRSSFDQPAETLTGNILCELHIFEAVRRAGIDPRIQIACSSEEYGLVGPDEVPITEDQPLRPLSPYAVSKVAQDLLGYQYFRSYGLKIFRTRTFNFDGPRRGDVFVCSTFAKQIAEIETGHKEPVVYVGNLDAQRDFTDVRDVARAHWLAVQRCQPGEVYNIGSGVARTIRSVLELLLSMTDVRIEVEQDPSRMRPSDVPILLADNSRFRQATGWQPQIPFEQTMKDLLNYWRERVR